MRLIQHVKPFILVIATGTVTASVAHAHFPWLATNDKGQAVMWFGESTDDRTYPMPAPVAAIELKSDDSENRILTQPIDTDQLVGLQSDLPVNAHREVAGSVVYGNYHGTKLTYHVEHLPQDNPNQWSTEPRINAELQTVIAADGGGVTVTLLHLGKPVADTEVKLFCEAGHEKAARKTDAEGIVKFTSDEVESGLNAVSVGITDSTAKGSFGGESYGSTTDYLTSTFRMGTSNQADSKELKKPMVDPNSDAKVLPTQLPELPEALTSFGAAISGGNLFAYGGHTGAAHSYSKDEQSNRLWSLDLSSNASTWEKVSEGPALQGLALVSHGGRVIRVGGFTAVNEAGDEHDLRSQTSVAAFDPADRTWTELSPLPEPRSSLDAAVLGDKVYVFGGWKLDGSSDENRWHQTAWSLDLSDKDANWMPLAKPTFQRRAVSVAAHDGKLFVLGGMEETGKPTTAVDIYDVASDAWQSGPSLPGSGMSGFGSAAFASAGKLYVSTMDGFVHRLSENGHEWETIAKSEPARFFHRMLPIDGSQLLLIGGANMETGKFTQIDAVHTADNR